MKYHIMIIGTILLVLSGCNSQKNDTLIDKETGAIIHTEVPNDTLQIDKETDVVYFYLIAHPGNDMSNIDQYLERVPFSLKSKIFTKSDMVYQALKALFDVKNEFHEDSGLQNALYSSSLRIVKTDQEDDTMGIFIKGRMRGGGILSDDFIKRQIEKTIEQYAGNYKIFLNGSEKEWRCALDESGICD